MIFASPDLSMFLAGYCQRLGMLPEMGGITSIPRLGLFIIEKSPYHRYKIVSDKCHVHNH